MRYCYSTLLLLGSLCLIAKPAIAQSIQAGDGGTVVTPVGNQFNITGNQVSGQNQFHNFQTFNVDAGKTANFIPNNATIQNILSRVSGGTPSQIQGIIQSTSGVNLFLMNPAGILFGNGASLNVNGSFTATTANAIGFGGNNWYNAVGNSNLVPLTGDPTQFAFTNINPGAIVNTGNLTLPTNQSLNLIGATVINTGTIATPGGNITIAAVEGGKAVQISTPGSILSYTLPVEAISAINPAIGNPVSLPELLTGNPLENTSGIEIKNGVVTLVRSQTALPEQSGLTAISGTISTAGSNGGEINVNGKTIAIVDPTININNATLSFEADRRLVFEDQADDTLTIGTSLNPNNQVTFKANSVNGIIESIDPKDTISINKGPLLINAESIKLGNIEANELNIDKIAIKVDAIKDIQLGDVKAQGAIQITTDSGNLKAGRIFSSNAPIATTLTATTGSIEVTSISAGAFGGGSSSNILLDVFSGKTFRALGTVFDSPSDTYSYSLKNANNQVFDFLATQTGKTISEVKAALPIGTSPRLNVPAPVSVRVSDGSLRIRYMGGGGIENTPNTGVTIQGGNNRFEIGPKATPNNGNPYIPTGNTNSFTTFITTPFDITENVSYQKITLPEGVSGSVGAIVRSTVTDGSLSIGTQDLAFGVLPVKPIAPKPVDPKISTVDLENRPRSPLNSCPGQQTIALAPTEPNTLRNRPEPESTDRTATPNPQTAKNPCIPDNGEDEILKILK